MPTKEFWHDINSERKHRRAPPWSTTSSCDTPQTSTCCGCSSPSAPSGRDTLLKMIYLRMPWNILRTSPGYFVFSLIAQFQDSFRCVVDDKRICSSYIFQCSTISRYLLYHSEREFLSFAFADPLAGRARYHVRNRVHASTWTSWKWTFCIKVTLLDIFSSLVQYFRRAF